MKSLKSWFWLYYIGIIVIPIALILFIVISSYTAYSKKNAFTTMKKLNEQYSDIVTQQLKEMEIFLDISNDELITTFFDSIPSEEKESQLVKAYFDLIKYQADLEDIYLISLDNVNNISFKKGFFISSVTTTMQEWYKKTLNNPNNYNIIPTHLEDYYKNSSGNPVISYTKVIFNQESRRMGLLLVDISIERLNKLIKSSAFMNSGRLYVIDQNNRVVLSTEDNSIMKPFEYNLKDIYIKNQSGQERIDINGEDYLIYFNTSDYTEWKIVHLVPEKDIYGVKNNILWYVFASIFIWIFISLIIWHSVYIKVKHGLDMFEKKMLKAANGDSDVHYSIKTLREIKNIDQGFSKLISRFNSLVKKNTEEQKQLKISELKALQAQINPHFLYNTLDSIVWLAEDNRTDDLIKMTLALARFFRIGLSKGEDIICVSEEVAHIRNYLIIQNFRYANKFQYIIDIHQSINEYKIPKLILQPLVENAIYHGIKNKEQMGIIKIIGALVDEKIVFEIIDNGAGMTEETLEWVRLAIEDNSEDKDRKSYGMKNVHKRIQLLFGPEHGLRIDSEYNHETRVVMTLPILKEDF